MVRKSRSNKKLQGHEHIHSVETEHRLFFSKVYAILKCEIQTFLPNSLCTILSLSMTSLLILVL
jgi:hypothetical protein